MRSKPAKTSRRKSRRLLDAFHFIEQHVPYPLGCSRRRWQMFSSCQHSHDNTRDNEQPPQFLRLRLLADTLATPRTATCTTIITNFHLLDLNNNGGGDGRRHNHSQDDNIQKWTTAYYVNFVMLTSI